MEPTRDEARDIWAGGPDGLLPVLRDHDALLRALRRIHDATGQEDEGTPTTLGYIRGQAHDALARHTDRAGVGQVDLADATTLRPAPGEVVVLRLGHNQDHDTLRAFGEHLRELFPDNRCVVLAPCASLAAEQPWTAADAERIRTAVRETIEGLSAGRFSDTDEVLEAVDARLVVELGLAQTNDTATEATAR